MGKISYRVRPETAVLTKGFDPQLSVGSASPPVYRSSTFVFSSPEAAERAFGIVLGEIHPTAGESPDLIYARLTHPNADILEDQLVPLERGAQRSSGVQLRDGGDLRPCCLAFLERGGSMLYTQPLYGGTPAPDPSDFRAARIRRPARAGWRHAGLAAAMAEISDLKLVLIETPANPTLTMTDIDAAGDAVRRHPASPLLAIDNTLLGPTFQHPLLTARTW